MSRRASTVAAAMVAALGGCGGGESGGNGGGGGSIADTVEIELKEQDASGVTGLATLSPKGEQTTVVLEMLVPFDIDPQPVTIHKGTCAEFEPKAAFTLQHLVDGIGGDDIAISLDDLRDGGYAINVHKSVPETKVYVACGEIT